MTGFLFKVDLPIRPDKDGDDQIPRDVEKLMHKHKVIGAQFFGKGSPREVTFICPSEAVLNRFKAAMAIYSTEPKTRGKTA